MRRGAAADRDGASALARLPRASRGRRRPQRRAPPTPAAGARADRTPPARRGRAARRAQRHCPRPRPGGRGAGDRFARRRPRRWCVTGYVDVGFAKAQGDGTSFHPADTPRAARLRRRPVRAGGELARRGRVDRSGQRRARQPALRQRLPAALGRHRRHAVVLAQHGQRRLSLHVARAAGDGVHARAAVPRLDRATRRD